MPHRTTHILLVEDNTADAVLLRTSLEDHSFGKFELTQMKRLDAAIATLREKPFDVILLDLGLPDSQGVPTLEKLQIRAGGIPIIVMTGLDDESTAFKALQEGAQDYLLKSDLAGDTLSRAIRYSIERARTKQAIYSTEQRLTMAVDATQMGIWDWLLPSNRLTWSERTLELFGLDKDAFDGLYSSVEQCIHPDDRAMVADKVRDSIDSGREFRLEYRVVWPDGSEHWIEGRGRVAAYDDQCRPTRMLGTVVDITQRKADEASARQRETHLAHLSRVSTMGNMAAGLAHELNQPLSAILNYASVALAALDLPTVPKGNLGDALNEITHEVRRAGAIISRMRAFVRKQEPVRNSLNINDLVEESMQMMVFELRDQSIRPELRLAPGLPPVRADSVQIEQVLVNLIYNALESMSSLNEKEAARKSLVIETSLIENSKMIQVALSDTGIGMAAETLKRLFEPFHSTKPRGLGMGLNISRSIIESHGGRLSAAPNPAGGMRFFFVLPVDESSHL